jgi:hypothetical protein
LSFASPTKELAKKLRKPTMKIRNTKLYIALLLLALFTAASTFAGVQTNLLVLPVASSMTEGIVAHNITVATFSDPGSVAPLPTFASIGAKLGLSVDPIADYTAVINWGDGVTNDAGTLVANGLGGLDVVGTHMYPRPGTNWIVVSISDVDGSTGLTTSMAIVSDAPLSAEGTSVGAVEGILFTGQIATFTDQNVSAPLSDFTASIDWGDESTSVGIVSAVGAGQFTVSGSHTYIDTGSYAVKVNIEDVGGSTASAGSTATVSEAPLAAAGKTVNSVEGVSFNGEIATLSDANTLAPISDYMVSIIWGDGKNSVGALTLIEPGSYSISGVHTYADEGSYAITVLIFDEGLNSVMAGSTAVVGDAPLSADGTGITPVEGTMFTLPVATFTDANPKATAAEFSAVIDWGDSSPTTDGIISASEGGFDVIGTHAYAQVGGYAISVTIKDIGGSTAAAGSTATVSDAMLTANAVPISGVEGTPFSGVVATFTDANPFGQLSEYSAVITWGDGSTNVGVITDGGEGVYNVSGSHNYIEKGSYVVTVDITDVGGYLASAGSTANIADAPIAAIGRAIMPVENTAFVAIVAGVTDSNPYGITNDFTATIDWGDGASSSGAIVAAITPGQFDVVGSHTYSQQGLYVVLVTIQDVGGASTVAHSIANATEPQIMAAGTTINAVKGTSFNGSVATCSHPDRTAEGTNSYTCLINWGDGTTSFGTMMDSGRTETLADAYMIMGTHTYANAGEYMVLVTIDDKLSFVSTSVRSSAIVTEAAANNATANLQIKATTPKLDKRTGWVKQVLTVKNMSGQSIAGPISVVFDNLQNEAGSVTLVNRDGEIQSAAATPVGSHYKNVPLLKNNLLAKKATKSITVYFDGGSANISYSTRVLAGPGAR